MTEEQLKALTDKLNLILERTSKMDAELQRIRLLIKTNKGGVK